MIGNEGFLANLFKSPGTKNQDFAMKSLTYNEVMNDFLNILRKVQKGEEIIIKNEKNEENLAVLMPYKKYKRKKERRLGILNGIATYEIKEDFEMTDEEVINS